MSVHHSGRCMCGDVTYQCNSEALDVKICHCKDCQKASGTAFSSVAFFPSSSVSVNGKPTSYATNGSTGLTVKRYFCPNCGSPLYSQLEELPDLIFIKTGSLDDPDSLPPAGHMWWEHHLSWPNIVDDLEKLPGNPPLG
ncbi:GFA family protein [Aestuariicella hydrocarbonica]|uniref:GFA family protein n=1 Tax=Pseudomaricurvus hydrocarbonicus TaxID=1470433 RepID=A0A9E5JSZ9_9GAMM|nr:GFA family protein [Aestuariicella hydrocarbonica]NHO64759.1 GFA family protein [Aestuariicella hydrocarbonica]